MASMSAESYMKTYSTFGGCDIVATFNGKVIGELQAITYSLKSSCIYNGFCRTKIFL